MKKIAGIMAVVLVVVSLGLIQAKAIGDDAGAPCYETQIIHHPAVDPVVQIIPAVPGFWKEFSPNKDQGPLEGAPSYPTDPRGTWSDPKYNGGPQPDASGVFHNGNGHGSWFYREQTVPEKTIVVTPGKGAYDEPVQVEVPCVVTEPIFINPAVKLKINCLKSVKTWVTIVPNVGYTGTIRFLNGRVWEATFTANEGYAFNPSDRYTVSDDGHYAVVRGAVPVVRCVVPRQPEIGTPLVENRKPKPNRATKNNEALLPNTGA